MTMRRDQVIGKLKAIEPAIRASARTRFILRLACSDEARLDSDVDLIDKDPTRHFGSTNS